MRALLFMLLCAAGAAQAEPVPVTANVAQFCDEHAGFYDVAGEDQSCQLDGLLVETWPVHDGARFRLAMTVSDTLEMFQTDCDILNGVMGVFPGERTCLLDLEGQSVLLEAKALRNGQLMLTTDAVISNKKE